MIEAIGHWQGVLWVGAAVAAGLVLHRVVFVLGKILVRRNPTPFNEALVRQSRGPSRLMLPLLMIQFAAPLVRFPPEFSALFRQAFGILVTGCAAWFLIRLTHVLEAFVFSQFRIDAKDNLRARGVRTQIQIFRKIAVVVVVTLAAAVILTGFEKVRLLGTSILASAGIAGIIVGLAAQRTIGTVLAGIQIAFTQPIRIDDVVIVENEWGRIEEITLTYVVVRIWDLRRLIVPITHFIEKPFQNWTRVTADLLGTVMLHVDYTVPVAPVREELLRLLQQSADWDGKSWGLQVTGVTERTVELRALMSATDASKAWNLRCEVREKLLDFIQRRYPQGLPKQRAEFQSQVPGGPGSL
jgi:small-conductance mechanosensitive channel